MQQSTKVMVRDAVTAGLGGTLLRLDGATADTLSLNLVSKSLGDDELVELSKSLVSELRRRHAEVQALRGGNVTLRVAIRLDDNKIEDKGVVTLCSALRKVADICDFRTINLFRNRFGEAGAAALASLLQHAYVQEMRLGPYSLPSETSLKLTQAARRKGTALRLPPPIQDDDTRRRRGKNNHLGIFKQSEENVLILSRNGGGTNRANQSMDDDDAVRLAAKIVEEVRERLKSKTIRLPTSGSLVELKIALHHHQRIGDRGINALVSALLSLKDVAWVSDLRLYANSVGDAGAKSVATLLESMVRPPMEIHLSDNQITATGAKTLLDAASRIYPVGKTPLWLQLNNNDVSAQQLSATRYKCCSITAGSKCDKDRCVHARNRGVPAVHLLCSQGVRRQSDATTTEDDSSKNRAIQIEKSNQKLGDDDAVQIAVGITVDVRAMNKPSAASAPSLVRVILDGNDIGDRGVVALAGALLHLGHLVRITKLDLARNNVTDKGAVAIADLVAKAANPVAEICLAENRISSCSRLIKAAKGRYTQRLLRLDMRLNPLTQALEGAYDDDDISLAFNDDRSQARSTDCLVLLQGLEKKRSKLQQQQHASPRQENPTFEKKNLSSDPVPPSAEQALTTKSALPPSKANQTPHETNSKRQARKEKHLSIKATEDQKHDLLKTRRSSSPSVGKMLAESMTELGYSPKHSRWVEAAFDRCSDLSRGFQDASAWTVFRRKESFEYSLNRALTSPQQQRDLQDKLLRRGCVALVLVEKRSKKILLTKVSVVACTDEHRNKSLKAIGKIVESCDAPKAILKRDEASSFLDQKTKRASLQQRTGSNSPVGVDQPVNDTTESSVETVSCSDSSNGDARPEEDSVVLDSPDESLDRCGWGDENEEDVATSSKERVRAAEACLACAEAETAAIAARDELDSASIKTRAARELRSNLLSLEDAKWDYLLDSISKGTHESVLDAFIPAFQLLDRESRGASLVALREDFSDEEAKLSSLQWVREKVESVVGGNRPATAGVEERCKEDRWGYLVRRVLDASRSLASKNAIEFTSVLIHWKFRLERLAHVAVYVLKRVAPSDFESCELEEAWRASKKNLVDAVKLMTAGVGDDKIRERLRQSASRSIPREQQEEAEKKQKELRRQRQLLLERYSQRPSDAGWKSSIKAKNVTYGTAENARIRYLDGRVVSTTGQKEIIIRDGPAEGEGYNRLKKTSGGTLRCAAAGSRTIT